MGDKEQERGHMSGELCLLFPEEGPHLGAVRHPCSVRHAG